MRKFQKHSTKDRLNGNSYKSNKTLLKNLNGMASLKTKLIILNFTLSQMHHHYHTEMQLSLDKSVIIMSQPYLYQQNLD